MSKRKGWVVSGWVIFFWGERNDRGHIMLMTSLVSIRKVQIDCLKITYLGEVETTIGLGLLGWGRLSPVGPIFFFSNNKKRKFLWQVQILIVCLPCHIKWSLWFQIIDLLITYLWIFDILYQRIWVRLYEIEKHQLKEKIREIMKRDTKTFLKLILEP